MPAGRAIKGEKLELLEGVRQAYGGFTEEELDLVSREQGSPWEQARGDIDALTACSTIISKEAIGKFYGDKIGTR